VDLCKYQPFFVGCYVGINLQSCILLAASLSKAFGSGAGAALWCAELGGYSKNMYARARRLVERAWLVHPITKYQSCAFSGGTTALRYQSLKNPSSFLFQSQATEII
jgi:hypothetical protein